MTECKNQLMFHAVLRSCHIRILLVVMGPHLRLVGSLMVSVLEMH